MDLWTRKSTVELLSDVDRDEMMILPSENHSAWYCSCFESDAFADDIAIEKYYLKVKAVVRRSWWSWSKVRSSIGQPRLVESFGASDIVCGSKFLA